MSYYILPKNNNSILVDPCSGDTNTNIFLSSSIYNYYNEIIKQINNMCENDSDLSVNNLNEMITIINPYEFIFSKVPGSKFSVSKLKHKTNYFYDFLEIFATLNIFEKFNNDITSLHISNNCEDTIDCYEIIRENFGDVIFSYKNFEDEIFKSERKFNFMFMDTICANLNNYMCNFIQAVMIILKCSLPDANIVIKIEHTIYKPIIDFLYFVSSLFEKVYIIKPNSNNITSFEKYVVCKGFIFNETKIENYKMNYLKLLVFLKKLENKNVVSILSNELPYFFINKMDDINIILGQQQLESYDQIISILKSKNKDEKIEAIKKSNIQKSVVWCEKYKIPCNKFIEKTNMFLPICKEIEA